MIHFITTVPGQHTIETYLAGGGARLRDLISPWTYPELEDCFRRGPLPAGTYIFADIERLDPAGEARAAEIWQSLQGDPRRWRTLNQPLATLRRLPLLQALHDAGINDFRAWPALGPAPADIRFPVFLRVADDHGGSRSDLLADPAALSSAIAAQRQKGTDLRGWIACEYAGLPRPDGSHAKHGAFVIAGEIIPRHVMFGPHWVVKTSQILTPATFHEQWVYFATNPHASQLAEVFALARVDYGRIDYLTLPDGRIRVWEINTNPDPYPLALAMIRARESFDAAWHARTEKKPPRPRRTDPIGLRHADPSPAPLLADPAGQRASIRSNCGRAQLLEHTGARRPPHAQDISRPAHGRCESRGPHRVQQMSSTAISESHTQ